MLKKLLRVQLKFAVTLVSAKLVHQGTMKHIDVIDDQLDSVCVQFPKKSFVPNVILLMHILFR